MIFLLLYVVQCNHQEEIRSAIKISEQRMMERLTMMISTMDTGSGTLSCSSLVPRLHPLSALRCTFNFRRVESGWSLGTRLQLQSIRHTVVCLFVLIKHMFLLGY